MLGKILSEFYISRLLYYEKEYYKNHMYKYDCKVKSTYVNKSYRWTIDIYYYISMRWKNTTGITFVHG